MPASATTLRTEIRTRQFVCCKCIRKNFKNRSSTQKPGEFLRAFRFCVTGLRQNVMGHYTRPRADRNQAERIKQARYFAILKDPLMKLPPAERQRRADEEARLAEQAKSFPIKKLPYIPPTRPEFDPKESEF